jgi:flagellar motility protein MotE (MotC chaperone)
MTNRLLILFALLAFASVPVAIGIAETKETPKEEVKKEEAGKPEEHAKSEGHAVKKKPASYGCLASEEVIQDIEEREKKIKEKEEALVEKQKDLDAQLKAVKEELAKLDTKQGEIQNNKAKELAANEEKVNKLIETLETMSPKAAAGVIGGVDEELAVTALTRITSVKAGKILSNLKNDKSSRLSEMMAYGKLITGKEKARGESIERSPANKQ